MRFLFVILFVFLSIQIQAQTDSLKNLFVYRAIYKYVLHDGKYKNLKVSRRIIDTDFFEFNPDSLNNMPNLKKELSLIKEYKYNEFLKTCKDNSKSRDSVKIKYCDDLSIFSRNVKNADYIMFYSSIYDNMIVVQVLYYDKKLMGNDIDNYEYLSMFNHIESYLFFFNSRKIQMLQKTKIMTN